MSRGGKDPGKRVKTARGRTASSNRWLSRQLNDPYVRQAKAEGYRSRAAYKLIELDEKFALLRGAKRVVDLGIAPGGWAQVVRAKQTVGVAAEAGGNTIDRLLAADLLGQEVSRAGHGGQLGGIEFDLRAMGNGYQLGARQRAPVKTYDCGHLFCNASAWASSTRRVRASSPRATSN